MNLLFLFLSLFFSVASPSTPNNNSGNTNTTQDPGGSKKDKFGNGDFIIYLDTTP